MRLVFLLAIFFSFQSAVVAKPKPPKMTVGRARELCRFGNEIGAKHYYDSGMVKLLGNNFRIDCGNGKYLYYQKSNNGRIVQSVLEDKITGTRTVHTNDSQVFYSYFRSEKKSYYGQQLYSDFSKFPAFGSKQVRDSNGQLQMQVQYGNGFRHGLSQEWHPNGVLMRSAFYRNAGLDSFRYEYDIFGKLQSAQTENKKYHDWNYWEYKDGILVKSRVIDKHGSRRRSEYNEQGILVKWECRDTTERFNENGILQELRIDDTCLRIFRFHPNGILASSRKWNHSPDDQPGAPCGIWETYDITGRLISRQKHPACKALMVYGDEAVGVPTVDDQVARAIEPLILDAFERVMTDTLRAMVKDRILIPGNYRLIYCFDRFGELTKAYLLETNTDLTAAQANIGGRYPKRAGRGAYHENYIFCSSVRVVK